MRNVTKSGRGAVAVVACGALFIGTGGSASAVVVPSAAANVVALTPAQLAADTAVKAAAQAKKAADAAAKAETAVVKAEAAVAKAIALAKALAAKKAADDAQEAVTAAKKAADAAAKAVAQAKVVAAKKAVEDAQELADQKDAAAARAAKEAATAAKAAQAARDAQAAKEAKEAAAIPGAPLQVAVVRNPVAGGDFSLANDFTVSWGAPSGKVKRYVVTVDADGLKTLYPVTATSLKVKGRTLQTAYRIEVASQDVNGQGASSTVMLAPAAPGAPTELSASATTSGLSVSWLPPVRQGMSSSPRYTIRLKDLNTGAEYTQDSAQTTTVFTAADLRHRFEVAVTAVDSQAGPGPSASVQIGDLISTVPRAFTAIRDPEAPTEVKLAWTTPAWQSIEPVTEYEVGVDGPQDITWVSVGLAERVTLTLPLDQQARYSVRAITASGPSPALDADVDLGRRTQLPSSGAPVVLSSDAHQVDVALYGWVGDTAADHLIITVAATTGNYRSEQVTANGNDGVAFTDLSTGLYTVTVVGHNSQTGTETPVYQGSITIDNDNAQETSVQASFDSGVGYWRGVYPPRHLPRVLTSKDVFFEGGTSMVITPAWDAPRSNITVSTNGTGGIAVKARQVVTLSAQGRPGSVSDWNMGVSWWDANGKQIAISRSKRITGIVNTWQPSTSTYIAPSTAVTATAFIEIGGMLKNETFHIDAITLQSQ